MSSHQQDWSFSARKKTTSKRELFYALTAGSKVQNLTVILHQQVMITLKNARKPLRILVAAYYTCHFLVMLMPTSFSIPQAECHLCVDFITKEAGCKIWTKAGNAAILLMGYRNPGLRVQVRIQMSVGLRKGFDLIHDVLMDFFRHVFFFSTIFFLRSR